MGFHPTDHDRKEPASATNQAAVEIMKILRALPTPRHAAAAIAIVRANLHLDAGADTEAKVFALMKEDEAAALELWHSINPGAGH
jgi:hypothetical protein